MTYPQPQVFVPVRPDEDERRSGWVFAWVGACVATWLAIGFPLYLMFFA